LTFVYGYRDLDEAIRIANSLPYAFHASVFSADIAIALRAAKHLDASAVLVNDHTAFLTDWMPLTMVPTIASTLALRSTMTGDAPP
ncbi:aldehyde dehydrogenase family protein, partial [Rhizobium ruizarguesonis]